MKWTTEQKRIIDLRNSNILVSAAAGSGKTAVLVERIVNLMMDENVDIDKFLVVTFTNAAAQGMKLKIQKSLLDMSHQGQDIRNIRRQLSLLNKSHITTIHSFCLDIVKNNFHVIGLDPGFRIGDTSELNILLRESIDEALESAYSIKSERFKLLVESFGENRGDTELYKLVNNLYKFLLSFPDPFKWINGSVNNINIKKERFEDSLWNKEILNYVEMQIEGAKGIVELGIRICNEPDGPAVYEETLKEDWSILDSLLNASKRDLISFIQLLYEFKAPRIKPFKVDDPKNINVNIEKQEEVKGKLRDDYKVIINSLKLLFPYKDIESYIEDVNYMYEPILALEELIIEIDRIYKDKKHLKSIVDFNDLEHYALSILRDTEDNPSDIANYYRNKIEYIFIDEYQDSNSLQETIISQIKRDNNLFMVGDVKQSIYRFRLADPSIFNSKYINYEKDNENLSEDIIDRVVELNKNFRSREEILNATNHIFSRIMTVGLGEIDYNEDIFLRCGNEGFSNTNPVELNIIDKKLNFNKCDFDNDDINDELESMETAELEALFAVKKIKELINEKIFDAEEESNLRGIQYKDIVILSRSVSTISNVFEEVFNKEGIPFYFDGGGGYFDNLEVQVMINILKLIDNIRQDIPLVSVMKSPVGNFTTEELIKIRLKYKKESYIDACEKYIDKIDGDLPEEDFSPELIEKLHNFFKKIYEWTDRSRYTHLNDLIWEILMETNYYSFAGTLVNGKLRQANLRLLADRAYEFEKISVKSLFKFLRYIEKTNLQSKDNTSTAKTLGENDNVVRLMTVHNSKGLEFPVVILSGLNKMFNLQDTRSKILVHKDLGIAPKYINIYERVERDTIARTAISKKVKLENLSEEMRILYVAMTRAIDRLIMVGSINKIDDSFKKWRRGYAKYFLYKGNSYMDWIGSCLFDEMDIEEIKRVFKEGQCKGWNINKIEIPDLTKGRKTYHDTKSLENLNKLQENIDAESYRKIERRLSYKYGYESSINIPTKLSVTAIKNLNSEIFKRIRFKSPDLSNILKVEIETKKIVNSKDEFKGSEIGTLIHLVMEHIDINKDLDKDGLKLQLEGILLKKLITESEFIYISINYLEKIEIFYKSKIGARMIKSNLVKKEAPFIIKKQASQILEELNESDFVLLQGIIDCYFEEDGEIVIIDYKTDHVELDNMETIKSEYKDQIELYKQAIEVITKKKVKESYLYLFSSGTFIIM